MSQDQEVIKTPDISVKCVSEYDGKTNDLSQSVAQLVIKDQSTYELAANYLKTLKKMDKDIETSRKSIVDPINKAKDAVQALFNPIKTKIESAIKKTDGMIIAYTTEQERIRLAEEEKLRKETEAKAKKEREAKEAQEKAWRDKQEAAQKEAERLAAEGKAEEAAKAQAEADKASAKADERREQAANVSRVAPTLASSVSKVSGLSFRQTWDGEVVNLMDLVKAIAEGKAPIEFIKADTSAIKKQASTSHDSLTFPGIRFFPEKSTVSR